MHVRVGGATTGIPLVLLHMSPLSGNQYEAIAPLLARGRTVIVPDRIGFGDSDRQLDELQIGDYAAATLDAIDALDVDEFDVIGMHTGSCEAVELATIEPRRVRRAGVVGVPHVSDEERAFLKERCIPPAPSADGAHLGWFWELWTHVTRDRDRTLAHDWTRQHIAAEQAWKTFHAAFDHPIIERMQALGQPQLVIWARDEIWELTRRAVELLPETVILAELGHLDSDALFQDAPAELADVIDGFLAGD
jgi:pimeloyl-ACP methyl ester carboxylesterase